MLYKDGLFNDDVKSYDLILSKYIDQEFDRHLNQIKLIDSKNIVTS